LHKFLAFDLEFDRNLPATWGLETTDKERRENERGIHITCAGLCGWNGNIWYERDRNRSPAPLAADDVRSLIEFLDMKRERGHLIVTWGGTASDFRVLAAASESKKHAMMCHRLALEAVDIPFVAASTIGTMMGLDAAAAGMGLMRKKLDSASMPEVWKRCPMDVVQHVVWDARKTASVYWQMFRNMGVKHFLPWMDSRGHGHPWLVWVTSRGVPKMWWTQTVVTPHGRFRLPTVQECVAMPLPKPRFVPMPPRDKKSCIAWIAKK